MYSSDYLICRSRVSWKKNICKHSLDYSMPINECGKEEHDSTTSSSIPKALETLELIAGVTFRAKKSFFGKI